MSKTSTKSRERRTALDHPQCDSNTPDSTFPSFADCCKIGCLTVNRKGFERRHRAGALVGRGVRRLRDGGSDEDLLKC